MCVMCFSIILTLILLKGNVIRDALSSDSFDTAAAVAEARKYFHSSIGKKKIVWGFYFSRSYDYRDNKKKAT